MPIGKKFPESGAAEELEKLQKKQKQGAFKRPPSASNYFSEESHFNKKKTQAVEATSQETTEKERHVQVNVTMSVSMRKKLKLMATEQDVSLSGLIYTAIKRTLLSKKK